MKVSFNRRRLPGKKQRSPQNLSQIVLSNRLFGSSDSVERASFSIDRQLFTLNNLSIDSLSSHSVQDSHAIKKNKESFYQDIENVKKTGTRKPFNKRQMSRINCVIEGSDVSCCLQWNDMVENGREDKLGTIDDILSHFEDVP